MKEITINFDYDLTAENGDEVHARVFATYYPPVRGLRDSFGAPLEPDEDGYLEVCVIDESGNAITHDALTAEYPDDYDRIVEMAWEKIESEHNN